MPPAQRKQQQAGARRIDDARVRASRRNLLQPLALLAGDFRGRIREGLRARGHNLLPSQSAILTHLDIEGSRPSELAASAGMSKQAMGKIVDELVEIGYLETAPDPDDGRAKIIRFTDKGLELLADSAAIIDEIWSHYASLISEQRLGSLRDELHGLLFSLNTASAGERANAGKPTTNRTKSTHGNS